MGSILPSCLPFGNDGGLQILRCQGFEVKYYDVTLDALTLKPSVVCNVGVNSKLIDGIAAVVLGGTSLAGGEAGMLNTLIGGLTTVLKFDFFL